MKESDIIVSSPVSILAKNDKNGYFTNNEIFENTEKISNRFNLKPIEGEICYLFGFSLSEKYKIFFLSLSVENNTSDHRNSKHCELHYVTSAVKPNYNMTVPYILKAICRKTTEFFTSQNDLIEAMLYIKDFLPEKLLERIIFSFNEAIKENVIFLIDGNSENNDPIEDFYQKFAEHPELYSERFIEEINNLYSKGYYKNGPSECLFKAVSEINKQIEEKSRAEEIKRNEEKARIEKEPLDNEAKQKKQDEAKSLEVIHYCVNKPFESLKNDDSSYQKVIKNVYPVSDNYFKNPLYVQSLVSYYSGKKDQFRSKKAWEACDILQIVEYYNWIKNGKEKLITYAEPDAECSYYQLYCSMKNFLVENKESSEIFLSLLFWCDQIDSSVLKYYHIDIKTGLKRLAANILYDSDDENDNFISSFKKMLQRHKIDKQIKKKIKQFNKTKI